jgi:hypothetical protein
VTYNADALFQRLPEIYQEVDADRGELRALLAVLAEAAEALQLNIEELYQDLFVETAAEDLIPYIGELIGVTPLRSLGETGGNRAWVANTISYRRRKGTVLGLRQVAQDVLGHRAGITEGFNRLEWTQNLNHLSRQLPRNPSLRDTNALELLGGPFESSAHTAEIRNVARERGRYGIANILIHSFTTPAFPVSRTTPAPGPDNRSFWFDPWGRDIPLFLNPESEPSRSERPLIESSAPVAARRRYLRDELEKIRIAQARGDEYRSDLFDEEPVLSILTGNPLVPIPPAEIAIVNLETWGNGPTALTYPNANGQPVNLPIRVWVDPARGRFRFAPAQAPQNGLRTDYVYGAPGIIGGGPYDRSASVDELMPSGFDFYRVVTKENLGAQPNVLNNLKDAIDEWNLQPPNRDGVIVIADSATYADGPIKLRLPAGSHLIILSADWPAPEIVTDPRTPDLISPRARRPVSNGDLLIGGSAPDASDSPGRVTICGMWLNGKVTIPPGNLGQLRFEDCTLRPDSSPVLIQTGPVKRRNRRLEAIFSRCVLGDITVSATITGLTVTECAIKGTITAETTPATFDRTTITRPVTVQSLEASESIFTDILTVGRTQIGCIRFSYFPVGSRVPRAFQCQPETAVSKNPDEPAAQVRARIAPSFTSVRPDHPGFLRLAAATPVEILTGAEDEDQMGVYHREYLSLRKANLRFALSEHLRIGLSAGIFDAN